MEREWVYLESLDSVRGRADSGSVSDAALFPQVLLEVMTALAMDRDVVVPYAYAFDSATFHRAATRIWNISRDVDGQPNPFRLHLHGHESFDSAIQFMIARTRDEKQPFVSSLFPELNTTWEFERPGYASLMEILSDRRTGPLREVYAQFAGPQVRRKARPQAPGLRDLTLALKDDARTELDEQTADTYRRLRDAVAKLDLDKQGFGVRSLLRGSADWPGARPGECAADLVEDPADLELVIEAVDTLYNRVVAASAAADLECYTTPAGRADQRLAARGIAQDAALGLTAPTAGANSGAGVDSPAFQLVATTSVDASDPQIAAAVDLIADGERIESGIRALLQAQSTPDSDFRVSIAKLQGQTTDRDYAACLDEHLGLVADLLGQGYAVQLSARQRIGLTLTTAAPFEAAGGFAGAVVGNAWLSAAFAVGAFAAGAIGSVGAEHAAAAHHQGVVHETYRKALGQIIIEGRSA